MKIRKFAKAHNHKVIGKLRRMKNANYNSVNSCPVWIDEANNEYWMKDNGKECVCIVLADGGII